MPFTNRPMAAGVTKNVLSCLIFLITGFAGSPVIEGCAFDRYFVAKAARYYEILFERLATEGRYSLYLPVEPRRIMDWTLKRMRAARDRLSKP